MTTEAQRLTKNKIIELSETLISVKRKISAMRPTRSDTPDQWTQLVRRSNEIAAVRDALHSLHAVLVYNNA